MKKYLIENYYGASDKSNELSPLVYTRFWEDTGRLDDFNREIYFNILNPSETESYIYIKLGATVLEYDTLQEMLEQHIFEFF